MPRISRLFRWSAFGLSVVGLVLGVGCSNGGAAGTGGAGGTGGTGGQSAVPRPCASEWEAPPGMPVGSNMCTYDFPSMAPPTRDCTQQDGSRLLYEYDASKPCGMPCATGRLGLEA